MWRRKGGSDPAGKQQKGENLWPRETAQVERRWISSNNPQGMMQMCHPTFYPQVQHWDEKETAIGIMDNT
ncbi:MAG: hypothetical protein COS71_00370, partial [Candidatus Moranbacteria bacterium CG06_land_8_20_14_3_00_40_12]